MKANTSNLLLTMTTEDIRAWWAKVRRDMQNGAVGERYGILYRTDAAIREELKRRGA